MDAVGQQREWKLDNIKGILIIAVVLGHLLELDLKMDYNKYLHVFIYLFHMPAFVFVTGYFAKCSLKNTLKNMLYPYLLFQIIYLIFMNGIQQRKISIQITTPYWIMWYLLAITVWSLLLFAMQGRSKREKILIMMGSILLSLLVGYVPAIGRYLSLSRIFVFFPFYFAGYIFRNDCSRGKRMKDKISGFLFKQRCRFSAIYNGNYVKNKFLTGTFCREAQSTQNEKNDKSMVIKIRNQKENQAAYLIAVSLLIAVFIYCGSFFHAINRNWLYEATSYAKSHYGISFRAIHLGVAFVCIYILFQLVPDRKMRILSTVGKNTLSVYLLHGFLIKLMNKYHLVRVMQRLPDLLETILLIVIAVILGVILSRKKIVSMINIVLGKGRKYHLPEKTSA